MTDTTQLPKEAGSSKTLIDALTDATAHLAGAASAYRTYAKRAPHLGKVPADPFFTTRADDFDKAVERARAALLAARRGAA